MIAVSTTTEGNAIVHRDMDRGSSPLDAFVRLCRCIVELEAIAHVTKVAMDDCALGTLALPRSLDRARALVGGTSEKATAALDEVARLKEAVTVYLQSKRRLAPAAGDDGDPAASPPPNATPAR
jgi:hypothetical protein